MNSHGKLLINLTIAMVTAVLLLLLYAPSVFATDPPSSTPTISNIHANTGLITSNDLLIYGLYNIPYSSISPEPANETYTLRLIDTDNATQLGVITPYVRYDYGYNKGVFGFYFSANITAGQVYTIEISQSPAYFASPQNYYYVIPSSAWTTATTQEANQLELTMNIISLAQELESAHDVTLLEPSAGGTVLSAPEGETYFRGAIYGIQAMAPDLFLVQSLTWDTTDRSWTTTQFDEYSTRFSGTFIGNATDNTSGTFGISTNMLMGLIFLLPILVGGVIVSTIKWHKAEPGYLFGIIALILTMLMGWMDPALFALILQGCVIYIGYLWFYSHSTGDFDSRMFSFLAFVWLFSTIICLIVEGAWLGGTEQTVINDLSAFTSLKISGLIPIPVPNLYFFRGIMRMLLWDYSFYSGFYEIIRYIMLAIFTGAAVWGLSSKFTYVFAQFVRLF